MQGLRVYLSSGGRDEFLTALGRERIEFEHQQANPPGTIVASIETIALISGKRCSDALL
jgi:hypothetical protein